MDDHQPVTASPAPGPPIRVFILDDHELVRSGLKQLLEDQPEDFEVIGESGSALEAARRIPALRPDVTILDVHLPDGSGFEVCRSVLAVDPGLKCLILTGDLDPNTYNRARSAAARGLVLKQADILHLTNALRLVASGETVFSPEHQKPTTPDRPQLNTQEKQILELLARSMTNRQISDEMHLSIRTVKNYVSSILAKLGLPNRTEAAIHTRRPSKHPG